MAGATRRSTSSAPSRPRCRWRAPWSAWDSGSLRERIPPMRSRPSRLSGSTAMRSRHAARVLAAALFALAAGAASGQSYPEKPIRIVTTVPGGSLDLTARVLAPRLAERLGKQVIVDNRGGILSMELVAKAPADGYSLLLASASLWTSQFLRDDVSWDPRKDYSPIKLLEIGRATCR